MTDNAEQAREQIKGKELDDTFAQELMKIRDAKKVTELRVHNLDAVDYEVVVRFLPKEFQLVYEALVVKGLSLGGGAGYDETKDPKAGVKGAGTGGGIRSESSQRRLSASAPGKYGSGKTVVRNEAAVVYRQKVDRKIRKLTREIKAWLDGGHLETAVRSCTNAKCRRFAEESWWYCPNCGSPTDVRNDAR